MGDMPRIVDPAPDSMSIRVELEAREVQYPASYAAKSRDSRGRLRPEAADPIRPAFQRDRDRIVHSKAFRRLKHKTQVFFATPFGHAGERVLNELMPGGFSHYEQSLRIVDVLERERQGLNLSWEVRDGIAKHSKGKDGAPLGMNPSRRAATLEGQVARVADMIAYVNHDIDDAVRAGVLSTADLPVDAMETLGRTSSERIGTLVADLAARTLQTRPDIELRMSDTVLDALLGLRAFLFEAVYENQVATAEFKKASGILGGLWERVRQEPGTFLDPRTVEEEGIDVATRDFLAGMTDRFAVSLYERLFIPKPWARPTGL